MEPSNHDGTVVVTGGSSGIGLALASLLAEDDTSVLVVDKAACPLRNVDYINADLSDLGAIESVAQDLGQMPLKGIANVAGVPGSFSPGAVIAVNISAPMSLTRLLLPSLRPGSSIVNIGSISAPIGRSMANTVEELISLADSLNIDDWLQSRNLTGNQAYLISKAAIIEWTRRLAAELVPRKVRANCVSPGPVKTPILNDFRVSMGPEAIDRSAMILGRHARPSEIAQVARFLLGQHSSWVSGINIIVDGGLLAERYVARHRTRRGK